MNNMQIPECTLTVNKEFNININLTQCHRNVFLCKMHLKHHRCLCCNITVFNSISPFNLNNFLRLNL